MANNLKYNQILAERATGGTWFQVGTYSNRKGERVEYHTSLFLHPEETEERCTRLSVSCVRESTGEVTRQAILGMEQENPPVAILVGDDGSAFFKVWVPSLGEYRRLEIADLISLAKVKPLTPDPEPQPSVIRFPGRS